MNQGFKGFKRIQYKVKNEKFIIVKEK